MRQRIAYWSVVLIAITTTFAIASTGSVKTISGCVDKKTGALRISSKCLKTETQLMWNQGGIQGEVGPQGTAGLNGIDGLIGPQGPQGLQGIQGPQGLPGKDGVNGAMGPQGPTGATGPQGAAGSSSGGGLNVYDSTGALIGPLVSAEASGVTILFNHITPIRYQLVSPNPVINDGDIVGNLNQTFFLNDSCSGTRYATQPFPRTYPALPGPQWYDPGLGYTAVDPFSLTQVSYTAGETLTATTFYSPQIRYDPSISRYIYGCVGGSGSLTLYKLTAISPSPFPLALRLPISIH
jgi:hypothetical protein